MVIVPVEGRQAGYEPRSDVIRDIVTTGTAFLFRPSCAAFTGTIAHRCDPPQQAAARIEAYDEAQSGQPLACRCLTGTIVC